MGITVKLHKRVKGFSLDVEWEAQRELVALFGFSGSGKTMTLMMIAGLMRPDAGRVRGGSGIFFDSAAGVNLPPQQRRLGYVMQDAALLPQMTVKKNIAFGLPRGSAAEREERVEEMIDLFHLSRIGGARPGQISGGQKQRVALARALIARPRALLLDEPFSALDWPVRRKMQELIKEVQARFDIPVIMVTHDFREVKSMAGRVVVYDRGRVLQTGAPGEIEAEPAGSRVRELVWVR